MSRVIRDQRLGIVWLAARLWVGYEFLHAGWQAPRPRSDRALT
jgi:uncharacterized membrane protein YphA (DoxX/SURF4 family)